MVVWQGILSGPVWAWWQGRVWWKGGAGQVIAGLGVRAGQVGHGAAQGFVTEQGIVAVQGMVAGQFIAAVQGMVAREGRA
jgi:hypothetical protein